MSEGKTQKRGFTLLEVMVAVAILGLGLTAILSAQAGAFANSSHARNISVATGLARCKMSEVEEILAGPNGFPQLDSVESGPCCDGDTTPNMKCTWKIEKPQFPEAKLGDLDLNASLGSIGLSPGSSPSGPAGAGAAAGLAAGAAAGAAAGSMPGGLPDLSAVGGMAGIEGMAMSMAYPILKPIFESSTRRVTVTLTWREGTKDFSMEIMQWVTSPRLAGAIGDADAVDGGAGIPGLPGLPGLPGGSTGPGGRSTGSGIFGTPGGR